MPKRATRDKVPRLLPKHLDWKQFEGLSIDRNILQDLKAVEMSFRNELYDPSSVLCRTVVEKAARRLYEKSRNQGCPRNWGLDELNNELFKLKIYDRKVHAKVLGLLQQTNPIVHGEVVDVSEIWSRIVIALAQDIVRDIYSLIAVVTQKSPS